MDMVLERCAGIDIGKNEVVACVRTPGPEGKGRQKETRTFTTFTSTLEAMAERRQVGQLASRTGTARGASSW